MRILGKIIALAAMGACMLTATVPALPQADNATAKIVIAGQVAGSANVFVPNNAGDYSVLLYTYANAGSWSQSAESATLEVYTVVGHDVQTTTVTSPLDVEASATVTIGDVPVLSIPFVSRSTGAALVQFSHASIGGTPSGPAVLDLVVVHANGARSHYDPARNTLIDLGQYDAADLADGVAVFPVMRGT